jgi:hypothetical protein
MTDGTELYVWGSYFMGLVLVASEIALLLLRGSSIRAHLGWPHSFMRLPRRRGSGTKPPRSDRAP